MQHSTLGASSAERWINCPGSVALIERINPPRQETGYAREGTQAHKVCEDFLQGKDTWELVFEGATDDMIDGAELYGSTIDGLKHAKGRVLIEQKLRIPYDEKAFGTADCVIANPDFLHVVDYKFGMKPVEVDNNPQLLFYGLGAFFALAKTVQKKIENVSITIVQPRAQHWEGPVRAVSMRTDQLLAWGENVLKPAMEATRKPDAPCNAGPWCGYCPVFIHCPINGRLPASEDFIHETPAELPAPETLTLERVAGVLAHAKRVEEWIDAVRSHALALLSTGTEIPGWKLVAGRNSRGWANEAAAVERFGEKAYQPRKLISPAQAEKLKLDLTDLVVTYPGNPTIAPESDKRQSLKQSAQKDFS